MMSSMSSQNILMALTVTVNKYASSNASSVPRRRNHHRPKTTTTTTAAEFGRRCFLLAAAVVAAPQPSSDSRTDLLQRYLKKSEENKAKNEKERLDSYYKRNYKDYFDFVEGSLQGKKEEQLTESEKGILGWLQNNK